MVRRDKISVTLDPSVVRELDDRVGEEYESRSEAVEDLLITAFDAEELISDLEDEIANREARIRELENELRAANRRIDNANDVIEETRELVQVQSEEQSLRKRQAAAGVLTRFKWWLVGDAAAREDEAEG